MKKISVGELRQNPAPMVRGLEAGESYELTKHNRKVATIVPARSSAGIIPRIAKGGARTSEIPHHKLRSASSVDELIEEVKGAW